jgi:hypothetical protein
MSVQRVCDRCGLSEEVPHGISSLGEDVRDLAWGIPPFLDSSTFHWHLCRTCREDLASWIAGGETQHMPHAKYKRGDVVEWIYGASDRLRITAVGNDNYMVSHLDEQGEELYSIKALERRYRKAGEQ